MGGTYCKHFGGTTTRHSSLIYDTADEILLLKQGCVEQHFRRGSVVKSVIKTSKEHKHEQENTSRNHANEER